MAFPFDVPRLFVQHVIAPPYDKLGRFAGNLATCIEAGVSLEQALQTTHRLLNRTRFQDAAAAASERIRHGDELYEALTSNEVQWPSFFIPVIKAGEQTGRLVQALQFLEQHCQTLHQPVQLVQNTWLLPVAIMLGADLLQIVVLSVIGPWWAALASLIQLAIQVCWVGAFVSIIFGPWFRPLIDPAKLVIPFLGTIEREIAWNRFFRVFSMLYGTGGRRVESMIEVAAKTIPNFAIRGDMQRVVKAIKRGQPISDSFRHSRNLADDEKQMIAIGDLAGELEQACELISKNAGEKLQFKMKWIQAISLRLTLAIVSLSIGLAVIRLITTLGPKILIYSH